MDWDDINAKLAEATELFEKKGETVIVEAIQNDVDLIERDGDPKLSKTFAGRILARAKYSSPEMPMNTVWYDDEGDVFTIGNYDYKRFKWAASKGFGDTTDNMFIRIPAKQLSVAERVSIMNQIK